MTKGPYSDAEVGGAVDHCDSGRGLGSVQGLGEKSPHGRIADENESKAGRSHSKLDLITTSGGINVENAYDEPS